MIKSIVDGLFAHCTERTTRARNASRKSINKLDEYRVVSSIVCPLASCRRSSALTTADVQRADLEASHQHSTLMLLAGEHPKAVQERLGHSSLGITLDVYSHVLPGIQAGAAAKLDGTITTALAKNQNGCQMAFQAG